MDFQMPEMAGYRATKILRVRGAKLPLIASDLIDLRLKIEKAGMNDFVTKLFSQNTHISYSRNTLNKKKAGS